MTEDNMALLRQVRKLAMSQETDVLRELLRGLVQEIIEAEVSAQIGAGRYERSPERCTQRNGHRSRIWETRVGELPLQIPKLRQGSYFPSLLEPRRRAEQALLAVVQSAYVQGVSTRKVDELLQQLGLTGIDKSRVSRICKQLDEQVNAFRERVLEGEYPYLWLDALYLKVRQRHRIVSMAGVIAIGVRETGEREVLGLEIGASEEAAFWQEFLRKLVRRGLNGVRLVISDAHEGLRLAITQVLAGSSWQRCRVHFMRNLLAHIPQHNKSMVAAIVRTLFAQPDREAAGQQLEAIARSLENQWPKAAALLRAAEEDILAYMTFPSEHWTRIYSTNPLERLNKEIKRRVDVVGIFPDESAAIRLVGAVLMETHEEWQAERRYFSQESMRKLFHPEEILLSEAPHLRLEPVH
jgi:putative transposase